MRVHRRSVLLLAVTLEALPGTSARAQVVAAPGYAVHSIPTPGMVQGGVVRSGGAILVGQGTFGVGTESILRLDTGMTTIATGFNSLGGFDMDSAGTLYVVDNGGDQPGAATGDTLFAIPNALLRTDAVPAVGQEVVPRGTIPFAQDVLVVPGTGVLVTDAAGPGAGRVVRVRGGTATNFITGLDFAAGLALVADGTLLVGNVDASFTGNILKYTAAGLAAGTLATHLSGAFDQVLDSDGNVLVSGGMTADGSSSTVITIAPDGTITERAHGFLFSTEMYFDAARNELLVLDSDASAITAICRDRDGNAVCDADQACTSPATVMGPRLGISRLATPPGDDTLAFSGTMQLPFPFSPPLEPVTKGIRVLLADAAGPVLDATIPGGAFDAGTSTGWKTNAAGTAWSYRNGSGGVLGLVKVVVKTVPKTPGLVKFVVGGKNGSYPVTAATLPVTATLVLDAPTATTGQCGTARWDQTSCVFASSGATLRCR